MIEWFEKSAYGEAGAFELYNLVDDPGKQKDLALTHPEVTSELRQQLQKWRKQVGAQMMTKRNTFHQTTMYYPMRALKNRQYKLIFNIASELKFPLARDLLQSPTWISMQKEGLDLYGMRSPEALLHHARIELYDLESDPHKTNNLAGKPEYEEIQEAMVSQLKRFQTDTKDPWANKWVQE